MLARLPALALVALGAVDALPVHEPEPLAPHHHHDAAHVHAKHGSVLDGLRELELDLEALTALAHRVKRAPSGPDGRPKLGHGGTLERAEAAAAVVDRSKESNADLLVYETVSPDTIDFERAEAAVAKKPSASSRLRAWLTSKTSKVGVGATLFMLGIVFPPIEARRSRRAARCTHRPLTRLRAV